MPVEILHHPNPILLRATRSPFYNVGPQTQEKKLHTVVSSLRFATPTKPIRYAVLGAGFAGLSVAWYLLQYSSRQSQVCIDIYDEVGIGGGASGVAGGLIHPYSPKGKLLWKGAECWHECLHLLSVAEATACSRDLSQESLDFSENDRSIIWRRGIIRPATSENNVEVLKKNASNCLGDCRLELIDKFVAQRLLPDLCLPFKFAIHMPQAVNIHPLRYLQALFLASKNAVEDSLSSGYGHVELHLVRKSVNSLSEIAEEYDAVIICLGAQADMLPELSGKLPVRTCRGIVAHLQLKNDIRLGNGTSGPSVLSDAWLAMQNPGSMIMGSTWQWHSRNYSPSVSIVEESTALEELSTKISVVYPNIRNWSFDGASAGVRAMPPLTPLGSLPLLGCLNDIINNKSGCMFWLLGGLGARGLLYHAWLGKVMAKAVLSCDENLIPAELTSWKKIGQVK